MKTLQAIKPLLARLGVKPNKYSYTNNTSYNISYCKHIHKPCTIYVLQAFKPFLAFFSVYPKGNAQGNE